MRTCGACKRALAETEYAKPERKRCKACELFNATRANERGRGKPLRMTREEMLGVFGLAPDRRCHYCGISEADYVGLAVPTPSGRPGLRLGLDRIDTQASYTVDNVVVCCLVCNRVKSSTFTYDEMVRIGERIEEVWKDRGLDARGG